MVFRPCLCRSSAGDPSSPLSAGRDFSQTLTSLRFHPNLDSIQLFDSVHCQFVFRGLAGCYIRLLRTVAFQAGPIERLLMPRRRGAAGFYLRRIVQTCQPLLRRLDSTSHKTISRRVSAGLPLPVPTGSCKTHVWIVSAPISAQRYPASRTRNFPARQVLTGTAEMPDP
jgi:hypothetical protein